METTLLIRYRKWTFAILTAVLIVAAAFPMPRPVHSAGKVESSPAPSPKPTIRITYVPPYGSSSDLRGQVTGVDPSKYQVAVYIKVRGGWWTKPYWAKPVTPLYSDGSWICDVTTGGIDRLASDYIAYLIPLGVKPVLMYGGANLPAGLNRKATAKVVVHRLVKK